VEPSSTRETRRQGAHGDIRAWLKTALDSERRQAADDAFAFINAAGEKRKHADRVIEWDAEDARGDASEPADDAGRTMTHDAQ